MISMFSGRTEVDILQKYAAKVPLLVVSIEAADIVMSFERPHSSQRYKAVM